MKNAKGSNWKSWLPTTESVWVLWKCSYRVSIGAGGGLRKHVPPAITFCVQVNAMHHVFTGIYALSLHVRLINLLYQSRLERNIWLCMGARLLSSSRESIVALIGHPDLSCSCVQTPEGNSSCQKCQHTQRFIKTNVAFVQTRFCYWGWLKWRTALLYPLFSCLYSAPTEFFIRGPT